MERCTLEILALVEKGRCSELKSSSSDVELRSQVEVRMEVLMEVLEVFWKVRFNFSTINTRNLSKKKSIVN